MLFLGENAVMRIQFHRFIQMFDIRSFPSLLSLPSADAMARYKHSSALCSPHEIGSFTLFEYLTIKWPCVFLEHQK